MKKKKMKKVICGLCVLAAAVSLNACGKNNTPKETTQEETTTQAKVELSAIHAAVKEVYGEDYIPSAQYDETYLNDVLGVGADLYESFIAEGPMISVHVDTFVAIEAKEGKGEEVEAALTSYRNYLVEESMQYPMNLPKIQASQIVRHGDYVFFVLLGAVSEDAMDEDAMLESAQASNQLAVDAIDGFFAK